MNNQINSQQQDQYNVPHTQISQLHSNSQMQSQQTIEPQQTIQTQQTIQPQQIQNITNVDLDAEKKKKEEEELRGAYTLKLSHNI